MSKFPFSRGTLNWGRTNKFFSNSKKFKTYTDGGINTRNLHGLGSPGAHVSNKYEKLSDGLEPPNVHPEKSVFT